MVCCGKNFLVADRPPLRGACSKSFRVSGADESSRIGGIRCAPIIWRILRRV